MAKRYIFGIWHGGINYAPAPDVSHLERFGSVSDALGALQDRARMGHHFPQRFNYVYREPQNVLTPNADTGAYIDVYVIRAARESDALALVESETISSVRHPLNTHSEIQHRSIL
jgi:hypothetical protein